MSKSPKNNSSLHAVLKSAVILYVFAFLADFILVNPIPVWGIAITGATFIGLVLALFMVNYTEFQKFGFTPVIAISIYEIFDHASTNNPQLLIESVYYFSVLLIALYFTLRVKKKKYQSKKR